MVKGIDIKIERSGFPIKFGELEFFFGTTVEELQRFFDVQENIEKEAKVVQEKIAELNTDNVTKQDAEKLVNFQKDLARIQYDGLLGDGSFDKIYKLYPDANQLLDLFDEIAYEVTDRLEQEAQVRKDKSSKRKAEYLKKKALKNKKK